MSVCILRFFVPVETRAFFVRVAAAGHSEQALALLEDALLAPRLEAVTVALKLDLGESPITPLEVREVAQDVLLQIHEARAEMTPEAGTETQS